jgi:hypothetical protein
MHLILLVSAAYLVPLIAMVLAASRHRRQQRSRAAQERDLQRQEAIEAAAGGLTYVAWQAHWEAAGQVPQHASPTELKS